MGPVRKVLTALAAGALSLIVVSAIVLAAAFFGLRSDRGKARALAWLLPKIQASLGGHLRVARIDGDLLHTLVVYDLAIDDGLGQPAIRAHRAEARFSLPTILFGLVRGARTITIEEVRGEGVWVRMRQVEDGRFNLATLGGPTAVPPATATNSRLVRVSRVVLDATVRYETPLPARAAGNEDGDLRPELDVVEGVVRVEGGIEIAERITILVDRLALKLGLPAPATLSGQGRLVIAGGEVSFEQAMIDLQVDGAQARRFVPWMAGPGPWRLHLVGNGPTSRFGVRGRAELPPADVDFDVDVGFTLQEFSWSGTARTAARTGEGTGDESAISKGHVDWRGLGELEASVRMSDLGRLAALGAPAIGGRANVHARMIRSAGAVRLEGEIAVAALSLSLGDPARSPPHLRVARLEARFSSIDRASEATLTTHGVRAGTIFLDRLAARAHGHARALTLEVDVDGPRRTRLSLTARGAPRLVDGRLVGGDAQVEGVLSPRQGRTWKTTRAAEVHVGKELRVDGLRLASGSQRLAVDGTFRPKSGAIEATVRGDRLDTAGLAWLLAPGHRLPASDIHLVLDARGTVAAPIVDAELTGRLPEVGTGFAGVTGALSAHYAAERLRGDARGTVAGQELQAHLDLPMSHGGREPIAGRLALGLALDETLGEALLARLTDLLPTPLRGLRGKASASGVLSGTMRAPRFAAELHLVTGRRSTYQGAVDVTLDYREARLDTRLAAKLFPPPRRDDAGGGALEAELHAGIDLGSPLVGPVNLVRQLGLVEWIGEVRLSEIDLARFPFAALGIESPIVAGRVSGSVGLHGTLRELALRARLAGRGLAGPSFDHADLALSADCERGHAHATGTVSLRGAPLLNLRASAELAAITDGPSLAFRRWRETPIAAQAEVPSYPLGLLPDLAQGLEGIIDGSLSLGGTLGGPDLRAHARVTGLRVGEVQLGTVAMEGAFDGSLATVKLDSVGGAARLHAAARVPLSATRPWHIEAALGTLAVDLRTTSISWLRTMQGTVSARLDLDGSRAHPVGSGFLRVENGAIAFAESPFVYTDASIDAALTDGVLTLRRLAFSAANGGVEVSGTGTLDGLHPLSFDGHAVVRSFPLTLSGVNGWLDARLDLHLQKDGTGLRAGVVVQEGAARLANLSKRKSLQSTSIPFGVSFVDAAGRRAAVARAAAEADDRPPDARLTVTLPHQFQIHGKEVDTALKGELTIALVESEARIDGALEAAGGWIDLLGRRYELERLRVAFDGAADPDPQLDVRISRSADVTVVIEMQGSASHPDILFSSLPPVYSQEQVMAMILSGDPGATQVSDQSLDAQVASALSRTAIGRLKDTLLPVLPLDVIKINVDKDATGREDTRLEVGKYITENVYVSYVHQLSGAFGLKRVNQHQLQLEYRFARRFEVETLYGDNGVGALDLYWNYHF